MKNRNDNKKYFLAQEKKNEVQRLFNRLDQINRRTVPARFLNPVKRMFNENANSLAKIPHNHNEQKLYDIRMENERLVNKLAQTKMTVVSHIVKEKPKHIDRYKMRNLRRKHEIKTENYRLYSTIDKIRSQKSIPKGKYWRIR